MRAGLTAAEITRMLADAEAAKADDDAIRAALVELRELDALLQASRILLTDPAIALKESTRAALREAFDLAAAEVTAAPAAVDIEKLTRAHRALETAAHAASAELYGAGG